jgi:hypothetical protein
MRLKIDMIVLLVTVDAACRAFLAVQGDLPVSTPQVKLHQMTKPRNTSPAMTQRIVLTTRR